MCSTLASVEFGLRIVDEFTEVVPAEPNLNFRGHYGDRMFFAKPRALSLLQVLCAATSTVAVSATPYLQVSSRLPNLLCTLVLLGAQYEGATLFGAVPIT